MGPALLLSLVQTRFRRRRWAVRRTVLVRAAALGLMLGLPLSATGDGAWARGHRPAGPPAGAVWVVQNDLLAPEEVFATLRQRYSGKHLDFDTKRGANDTVLYEIIWLTDDGRKLVFLVNARTGAIVSTEGSG